MKIVLASEMIAELAFHPNVKLLGVKAEDFFYESNGKERALRDVARRVEEQIKTKFPAEKAQGTVGENRNSGYGTGSIVPTRAKAGSR
jgi:hypothetical protein